MTDFELKFCIDGDVYIPVKAETEEEAYTKVMEYLVQITHGGSGTWIKHLRTRII